MKNLLLLSLVILGACASGEKNQVSSVNLDKVTNESFKKTKQLAAKDIVDHYPENQKSFSPALQDETLDRYSADEISSMDMNNDPLFEIALRCSKKDYDKAFGVASKIFNEYQKISGYWNLIANCHLNQGAYRKALLFYNKALEMSPNYVPALNNIGVMYSRLGQEQKALVAFERANKQGKFSKTPRYNLGKLYLTYGLAEAALPILQGLLSTSPDDADLLNAVGSCFFLMSDYQRAWSYYQKIPKPLWEEAEFGLNIAITLKKTSQKADALKVFADIKTPKGQKLKNYYASVEKQLGAQ